MRNTIQNIASRVSKIFEIAQPPAQVVPPFMNVMGASLRPGLSAKLIASRIIKRRSEAGAITGPAPDGTQNVSEAEIVIMIEEIVNALCFEAKIDVAFAPGSILVTASGANGGGPVLVTGSNISTPGGTAILQ
jgi:hypothetical protein